MREGMSLDRREPGKSPDRHRLVVDSRVGRAEWVRREPDERDVMDRDQQMEVMLEAAHRAAAERAKPSDPSVDDAERGRLEELKRQFEAVRRAVETAPAWKRWISYVVSDTELARQNASVFRLASEIREQEDLVRDLAAVLPVDALVESVRRGDPTAEERSVLAFREIRRSLGASGLFGRLDVPRTNAERASARTQLERMAASSGKVRAKWANAGLRLLSAYEAAHPTREDVRMRVDAARAAEFARTGPMELVDGRWVRISNVPRADVRNVPFVPAPPEESPQEELFAK